MKGLSEDDDFGEILSKAGPDAATMFYTLPKYAGGRTGVLCTPASKTTMMR